MKHQISPYIQEVYEFLKNETQWLHARWIIFEQLYNKSPLRIDLLNESAGSFFHMLQIMMYDDLQLSLARLTDPAPDKASLFQLQKRLESHGDAKLVTAAKGTLDRLTKAVKAIRAQRDNLIAHHSLEHATNSKAEKLPDVYYQDVVECLRIVRVYMTLIELHYHGCEQGYEHFAWQDDGDNLVTVLKWGIRYREQLMKKEFFEETKDKWSDA